MCDLILLLEERKEEEEEDGQESEPVCHLTSFPERWLW